MPAEGSGRRRELSFDVDEDRAGNVALQIVPPPFLGVGH
jgi:hypothetical protein